MKQDIENIIRTNLPEEKITSNEEFNSIQEDYSGGLLEGEILGHNQCLSKINTTLIADEVLKVVKLEIEKDLVHHKNHFCKKYCKQFKECALCYFERKLLSEHLSLNKENKNNG